MSGLLAQVGFANETIVPPVSTAGTSVANAISPAVFVNSMTFGSAHGLVVGSTMVLSGYTAAAWNSTVTAPWIVYTVPSTTTLTFLSAVPLGVLSVHGTISASVYGSQIAAPVNGISAITPAPNRFTSFMKEGMKLINPPVKSTGVGANRRVQSSTRWVRDRQGAAGDLQIEVESKGWGFWGKHLVGPVATSGPTDSAYTHIFSMPVTLPGMLGTSFNFQGTVVPPAGTTSELVKTYIGCKVVSWQFDFAVGQLLTMTATIDAMDEAGAAATVVAKATASYSTNPELLSFAGGTIQFGGTTWDVVRSGSIKCDMGYNADRRFVRANSLQREPAEQTWRIVTIDLDGEFDSVISAYNKYASSVASQAIAQINLAFVGKILIGATTFPSLTFNIPVARFDGDTPTTDGPVLPTQHVVAEAMFDGTNSPINATYVTLDSTP